MMMTIDTDRDVFDEPAGPSWLASSWAVIRQRWWLVAGVTLAAAIVALAYLRSADYLYTATLRIAPAPSTQSGRPGFGALSSLASLAGVGGDGADAPTPFRLYLEGVYVPEVAEALARDPATMHTLFAREWDPVQRVWRQHTGLLHGARTGLIRLVGQPEVPWRKPDGERLREFIGDHVGVAQSVKSPLVTISFDATDPAFAVRFLDLLGRADDDYLRRQTLLRTRANVAYLAQKLATVTLAEHRLVLSAQLSEEERQLMMASSPSSYAADRFGRITVSSQPTRPKPLPVFIGFVLAGLVLGVALAIVLARGRRV